MKKTLLFSLLIIVFAAACGGGAPAATPLPTSTTIPFYNYTTPSPVAQIVSIGATDATEAVTAEAVTIDPEAITAGQGRYVALACGGCHGDDAKGSGDKGPSLIDLPLSQDEFITFLRTGGKLGNKHLYASNRISDKGAANLYLYLKSLTP